MHRLRSSPQMHSTSTTVQYVFVMYLRLSLFFPQTSDLVHDLKGPYQLYYVLLSFVNIGHIVYMNPTHFPS